MDIKIDGLMPTMPNRTVGKDQATAGIDFKEVLNESLRNLNETELNAQEMDRLLAIGEIDNLHDVMVASQQAEIALNLALEIKTQVIDAYKEIMRLQL